MSPIHAKAFVQALSKTITQYEEKFGEIDVQKVLDFQNTTVAEPPNPFVASLTIGAAAGFTSSRGFFFAGLSFADLAAFFAVFFMPQSSADAKPSVSPVNLKLHHYDISHDIFYK